MTDYKTIMLLGAAGQIGYAIQAQTFPPDWELRALTRFNFDITDVAALRKEVQTFQPRVVINCAGITNVDQAEREPELARAVNFEAVANIAAQCAARDIPLIHLSTDYVFDGRTNTPYQPDDPMNPVNQYGASKLLGEEAIRHTLPWHVILRVSSVFGAYGRNILTNFLQMAETQPELRMVTDICSSPTPAAAISDAIMTITNKLINGKIDGYGTFHFCGQPAASRYDFALQAAQAAEPFLKKLPIIHAAKRADFPNGAERPAYSVMDCHKIYKVYGLSQPDWQPYLQRAVKYYYMAKGMTA